MYVYISRQLYFIIWSTIICVNNYVMFNLKWKDQQEIKYKQELLFIQQSLMLLDIFARIHKGGLDLTSFVNSGQRVKSANNNIFILMALLITAFVLYYVYNFYKIHCPI